MKYYKTKIFALLLAVGFMIACEEQEKVIYNGGQAPDLVASSTDDMVLSKTEEGYSSLQFQWNNPDYQFSNGTNTQDVNYTLEIDTTGANFSSSKKVSLSFTNELQKSFKVKDLNNTLSIMELKDYVSHPFEFRVKSTLAGSSVPLYSNVVKINITTYLDVVYPVPDKLYITGAATPKDWMGGGAAPEPSQEFTKINPYTFELAGLDIKPSAGFLLVPVYGNWDHKYGFTGDKEANNVNGDSFRPEGNDFKSPDVAGNYKITVNFKTGKYSMIKN